MAHRRKCSSARKRFWAADPSVFVVPIEVLAAVFFVLIALQFIGLGQVMGRAFDALSNRVAAYTINVLGSLAGIVVFGLMSLFRTPPLLWFGLAIARTCGSCGERRCRW